MSKGYDFGGQEGRDPAQGDTPAKEAGEPRDAGQVRFSQLPQKGSVEVIHSDNPRLHTDASHR